MPYPEVMTTPQPTEDYQRALVDEALNRTPPGGFPEIEQREELAPGTLFDWVGTYGPRKPPAPFSALLFWIGTTQKTEAEFHSYFEVPASYWDDEDTSAIDAGVGFNIDLDDEQVYDECLLLSIHHNIPRPVADLIAESTLESDSSARAIVRECANRGIHTANAMFVYADPAQTVVNTTKLYNQLSYIGLFADERCRRPDEHLDRAGRSSPITALADAGELAVGFTHSLALDAPDELSAITSTRRGRNSRPRPADPTSR